MIENSITRAINGNKKDFPCYVSDGVLSYVKEKVSRYVQDYVDFENDFLRLRFEMDVVVDVSTVDVGHDDRLLENVKRAKY